MVPKSDSSPDGPILMYAVVGPATSSDLTYRRLCDAPGQWLDFPRHILPRGYARPPPNPSSVEIGSCARRSREPVWQGVPQCVSACALSPCLQTLSDAEAGASGSLCRLRQSQLNPKQSLRRITSTPFPSEKTSNRGEKCLQTSCR